MWFKSHKISLTVAMLLLIGVALPVSAQGEDPYIVAWIGGATAIGGDSDQGITGQDYVVGESVDLYLNDEYVATAIAEQNAEGTGTPSFEVAFMPGDEIRLVRLNDSTERVLVAHDIGISETSSGADAVSGWAAPWSEVLVIALGSGTQQIVTADTRGNWTADFSSSYDIMTGDLVAAMQSDADGDFTGVFASVEGELPPQKVNFNESYRLPQDRELVPDQGWLNVGCGAVVYEMVSGKLHAQWKAKYVGEDESTGDWIYEMTQDFDWKKPVFESYAGGLPTGALFDVESNGDFEGLVRVVDATQPVGPGNVEILNGEIEGYFYIYDQTTGSRVDWIEVIGTYTDGVFEGTMQGTCGG